MTQPNASQDVPPIFLGGGGVRYGVAHIDSGRLSHVKFHGLRDEAMRDLADCKLDDADCFLVRQTVTEWERVPDGA